MIQFVKADTAIPWVVSSLSNGSELSTHVEAKARRMTEARILGGPIPVPSLLDDRSRGVSTLAADEDAAQYFEEAIRAGFRTLLVEHDMSRKGDPWLPANVAFVEARVLQWTELSEGVEAARALLRTASTGYPLNAFISRKSIEHLRINTGAQLDSLVSMIAENVDGVIVSVFDGEAFIALT